MADVIIQRAGDLDEGTPQTPGLRRLEAISSRLTGSEHIWMGLSVLPPGGRTAWHHHGDSETALYVLSGTGRWWIGDAPADVREAHPGDFVFVPPRVPHWEENGSLDQPVEMIVARSTQEAIVVNIDHPLPGIAQDRDDSPPIDSAATKAPEPAGLSSDDVG